MTDDRAPWAPLATRVAWARAWRRTLARRHAEITRAVSDEIGKGVFECFVSEIVPLLRAVRHAERAIDALTRDRRIAGGGLFSPGVTVRRTRVPLGRVALIATWNYPVGLLGVQLAHALIAGNRVVVKPSERSPHCQRLLLELARDPAPGRGLPPGVLEWTEATRQAGEALLADQRFDHVVFTGSTEVGRRIAATLAGTLTPSTLELSGRDSAIVLDDADPRLAAASIWSAVRMNAGQTCMGPRRAIVCQGVYDAFVREIEPLVAGTPALLMISHDEAVRAWTDVPPALGAGARPVGAPSPDAVATPPGRTVRALALGDCPRDAGIVQGRHFAPILAIVRARDERDALAIHAAIDQRLATSLFTRRVARARRVIAPTLASTIITINDCLVPTGHPGVALGGLGPSGWGLSRGREGLLAMLRPVHVTTTSPRFRTPTTPLEGRAADRFMRFAAGVLGR